MRFSSSNVCADTSPGREAWGWLRRGLCAAFGGFVMVADAAGVLPSGFFAQVREQASATIDVSGHRCPLDCYTDDAGFYQAPATSGLQPALSASVIDPVLPANLASVNSSMGMGWMQGSLSASVWSTPPPGTLQHHATASGTADVDDAFADILRIRSAGLAGWYGLAHARLLIRSDAIGALDSQPIGAAARERAWVDTEVSLQSFQWQQRSTEGGHVQWLPGPRFDALHYQADELQTMSYDVKDPATGGNLVSYVGPKQAGWLTLDVVLPFVFGEPLGVEVYGSAEADVRVAPPALDVSDPAYVFPRHAAGQASLAVQWGGLLSVELDPQGMPLRSAISALAPIAFTVESASGANYLHALAPVPEPPAWLLLVMGTLPLARRHRQPAGIA